MKFERNRYLFFLMFSIIFLLSINFTILRNVRSTLAVVDLGNGAQAIPFFEIFGAMPGAILMVCGLTWLMNRFSILSVFFIVISVFVGFFLCFTLALYPLLVYWKDSLRFFFDEKLAALILQGFSMSFYVMAELWKPALMVILFWGLINQSVPLDNAKKLYAPLMLGASLGATSAGPLISGCTSKTFWGFCSYSSDPWTNALTAMMLLLTFLSCLSAFLYYQLWKNFKCFLPQNAMPKEENRYSLKECVSLCFNNPKLKFLGLIIVADYIAYTLVEVVFLDVLKQKYPDPCSYCHYMGYLTLTGGVLTIVSALCVAPFVLKNCRWVVAALVTPVCLLFTEGAFFFFLRSNLEGTSWFGWTRAEWLTIVVLLGSIQLCLCRAVKYTFFDASKELVFVTMPDMLKLRGKLALDGIVARLGRGGSSLLSIFFITISGGVLASSLLAGITAISMSLGWIAAAFRLGSLMENESSTESVPCKHN